jgi:hypothetical protein
MVDLYLQQKSLVVYKPYQYVIYENHGNTLIFLKHA